MLSLAPRSVELRRHNDALYLSSGVALDPPVAPTLGALFLRAADAHPDRVFLVERRRADDEGGPAGSLRSISYADAKRFAQRVARWVRTLESSTGGAPAPARVMALSGSSMHHALLMLGCFLAGVPFVPVSPAYSLMSKDFAKLRIVNDRIQPAAIFVESRAPFAEAVKAIGNQATIVDATDLARMGANESRSHSRSHTAVEEANVTPDHVAKILFTSGSTGFPKGVPNTHRMLCANQQMIAQLWPFLAEDAKTKGDVEVLVDWLPWSHTFGGNHNFNMVLQHAATLLIDEGRPAPGPAIDASIRNLKEMPPTLYFNVPAGYASLVPHLEKDDELRRAFFSRLKVMFYAAAALPPDLWNRLVALAKKTAAEDRDIFMTTAWGSTETSPLVTSTHFISSVAGNIGLPAPGVTLKIVPNGSKKEVRVKGPNVFAGYLDEPALTAAAFDEEGFYKIGDAVKLADPIGEDPAAGLLFDGRVAEDFKLSSGTWVSVTSIRTGLLTVARGLFTDLVICGQDHDHIGVLAWLAPNKSADATTITTILQEWNASNPATSTRVERLLILKDPPNIDAGEITDKGYINQRATIEHRALEATRLFTADPNDREVFRTLRT